MTLVVRLHNPGDSEALILEECEPGKPGAGEIRIRQTAIGLNYIDIYHRTGLYKLPSYPAVLGMEAAGIVEAVGEAVTDLKPGDRVAYCGVMGAYAQARTIPANRVIIIPDGISEETAAAVMLKGLTAQYLLRRTFPVKKGDMVLLHAAAGGVGLIAAQWAHHLGATVIGTVGSEAKTALAKQNGCHFTIDYTRENLIAKVKEYTGGKGVDVVYDSVGQSTFMHSLDCLKTFGMMVSFGQSSGAIGPIDPALLSQKGALYLTRPTLMHHIEDRAVYQAAANELFALIREDVIKVHIGATYPLSDIRKAHEALEARQTIGATILKI